jgi:hypothetical protein
MVVAGGAFSVLRPAEFGGSLLVALDAEFVHSVHVSDRETRSRHVIRLDPGALSIERELMAMAAVDRAARRCLAGPRLFTADVTGGT